MSSWKNVQYKDGKMRTSEGGGGGSSTFAGLDDVNFSNLANGQIPKYNSTTQKWENANESGGGGGEYLPLIYSEEEREVGVWYDGKPIYSKVIRNSDRSALPQLNDVTDLHIDKLISAEGLISDHSDRTYPRGLITTTSGLSSREIYMPDANTVQRNGDQFSCFEIILYYTKTTDTPGSGTWTPSGEYAHHYSTIEQVIGTWIDGKPLYEQSIVYTNSSGLSSGSTTLETIATGLNMIPGGIRSIIYNTDGRQYPLPYVKTDGGSQVYYNKTSGDVVFLGQNDSWGTGWNKLYIVLQYIKDSDT